MSYSSRCGLVLRRGAQNRSTFEPVFIDSCMQPKVRQLSFRLLSILSIGAYRLLVEGLVIIRHLSMGTGDQIIDIVDVFRVLVTYSLYHCTDGIYFDEFIIGFGRWQIRAGYSLR